MALRLVSSVAATWPGERTSLARIDKTGAITGKRPNAVRRSAVWVAPGSGLVIKTRFKRPLLSKSLRSVM
jgi:hypothetical protein